MRLLQINGDSPSDRVAIRPEEISMIQLKDKLIEIILRSGDKLPISFPTLEKAEEGYKHLIHKMELER